jgi:hypothetical protein
MAKPNATRQNSVSFAATSDVIYWLDYDPATMLVTNLTVDNQSGGDVYAEIVTTAKVQGKNLWGQTFAAGLTSLPVPKQANVKVGFDPNDGNAPYLTGIESMTLREPA